MDQLSVRTVDKQIDTSGRVLSREVTGKRIAPDQVVWGWA